MSEKELCYITKIFKIESNSQLTLTYDDMFLRCVISQRYSKLKAIHNASDTKHVDALVVLYHKDIQN